MRSAPTSDKIRDPARRFATRSWGYDAQRFVARRFDRFVVCRDRIDLNDLRVSAGPKPRALVAIASAVRISTWTAALKQVQVPDYENDQGSDAAPGEDNCQPIKAVVLGEP